MLTIRFLYTHGISLRVFRNISSFPHHIPNVEDDKALAPKHAIGYFHIR